MKLINNKLLLFILFFGIVWLNSFIGTNDYANWWIENILTFITLIVLVLTYRYFRFSIKSYFLITLFLCLHVYGSKYTYAENVFGYGLKDVLQLSRNPYDRIVHFSFGFLLYLPLKELFKNGLKYPFHLSVSLPVVMVLALSGGFEILEWLIADIFFKAHGESYLGTQGDVWDAQKDMALAFLGSVISFFLFYKMNSVKKTD